MAERELAILIRARDLASKTIRGVKREVGTLGKAGGQAAGAIAKLGAAAAGVGLAGLAGSVKVAADFESQLNTINTVAGKTPAELAKIGEGIRKMARDTGAPLADLTQGFYDLVSAGVAADQAQQVLASSNRLAIGGLATAAEGVDLITTALNSYGVSAKNQGKESERFADIFAKAIERGKVTAAELAGSFANVGPLAASMKIEIEEVAAAYAQMTAKGIPAAQASTSVASALIALQRKTAPLKALEKQTGRNYAALAGRKGLAYAFDRLRKDAEKAGVPLIEIVGRQEALQFALANTGTELKSYNANLDAMTKADGTAARQMAERQKGLNFQLDRLRANVKDAGIVIGSKLIPKLVPLAERMTAFLTTHEGDISKFGDEIAGAFDKAVQFAEKIPWGAVGSGLKTAAEWSGKLMDTFLRLPPEVQATIVALAGLNKLSGGAVTSIVGELGKGLIKGVLGMNAGVVNINAGVVNGAGGMPGAAGAAGGGTSLAGKVAIGATIVGGVALSLESINQLAEANAAAAAQGLTPAETAAMRYYTASTADQAFMAKHLGHIPTKADFDSATAKLRGEAAKTGADIRRFHSSASQGLAKTAAAARASANAATVAGFKTAVAAKTAGDHTVIATRAAGHEARAGGMAAAAAIRAKRLRVTVRTNVSVSTTVSARDVSRTQVRTAKYGSTHTIL